jgi:hypothetical protein
MALYKYSEYLQTSTSDAFDGEHKPGATVPHSGIYRCIGCGREAACNAGDSLPPQNHHQHNQSQGAIRWKLVVYAHHEPK